MINELIYLEKDFYAPVQKIKYIMPNDRMPTRVIKIASPKRNHSVTAALSAIAAVAISFIILTLSHSSQADPNHGFFWWMDKNSSGTSIITSPNQTYLDYNGLTNMHLNNYEINYSLDDSSIIVGMTKKYNIPSRYRFCYKRTYDSIDINVYYYSDLLFLWEYNGYDYYVIADKYDDALWIIIQNHIDWIKNNE